MKNWRVKLYKDDAIKMCSKLEDNSVDFFCYDPPYSSSIKSIHSSRLQIGHRENKAYLRSMTPFVLMSTKPFPDYMAELLDIQYSKLKPNGNIAAMMTDRNLFELWTKIPHKLHYVTTIYYLRPSGGPHYKSTTQSSLMNIAWSIIVLSKNKKHYIDASSAKPYLSNQVTADGKERKLVHNVWHTPIQRKQRYFTAKPLKLGQALVSCFSPKGAIVVDCFCGSGWIGEAAITTGRKAILSDISDDAIDATKVRLLPYTFKL